ncbi:hypothetical protein KR200_003679, partial [Drosophila serrata]
MNAYEYCIKLIAACEKLRDKVENFTESDEFKINQDTVNAALNKYKKFGCFPNGLSPAGLRSYGNLVAKWENQVHELFLLQNLFSVVEEHKDGLQIKVTFGQMQGWCPMSDDPQEITSRTTSTTSTKESLKQTFKPELVSTTKKNNVSISVGNNTDSCQVSNDVSRWIHNEINSILNMSNLMNRFSGFEKLLGDYRNQSCCSYKSIRDRVEIINDGIDILEDLQDLKPSEKRVYSDIDSDYRNLNTRLDHLKSGNYNYSSGKCCPAFINQFKSFQTNLQSNLNDFTPPKSNITLNGLLLNLTILEDTCSQQQNQLTKSLQDLNNNRTKINNKCCIEEASKINLMENSLKDIQAIKSLQDLSENINSVRENLWKSNKTLSHTENLLDLEAKEIEKLKKQSENISKIRENKTLINSLSLNISKLVIKLNDMESIRTMDLSKLNTNSFKKVNITFKGIKRTKANNTEKQEQNIAKLMDTFENINLRYSSFHVYHELFQMTAKKVFEKYRKHHNDLNKSIKAIEASPQGSLTNDDEVINPDINKLEKDLVNLTDNSIPKLALEIKYRRKDIADKLERKEQQDITWFNEEIKKKKLQILERLDKLNQKKVDSEKVRQLEAYILQLSDRHRSLAQRIEDRHEVLKQNVNELSKGIAAASSNALSCHHNCNLANFPTMDALAKRVKVLEQQLKN